MARFCKYLLIAALALLTCCQEGGEAGDLFGQWCMKGSDAQYVSFSGSVMVFRSRNEGEVYGNFQHQGDSLFIQCYAVRAIAADTLIVTKSFGFPSFTDTRVKITTLDNDNLVLSKENRTWSFYKY